MGIMLPSELVWVMNLLGLMWPDMDEDDLRKAADEMRSLSEELGTNAGDAQSGVAKMLGANSSESLELFNALWKKVADQHLPQMQEGMKVLAAALDISAVVVVGMKVGTVVQLIALAAEIIADEAAAPFTFGASEAAIPAEIAVTRGITKAITDKAIKAVEDAVMDTVTGAVFTAIGSAGADLAKQLVAKEVGVGDGHINVGEAVKSGAKSAGESVDPTAGSSPPAKE